MMIGKKLPKSLRNRLGYWTTEAWKRELSAELSRLREYFQAFDNGTTSAFELNDLIHIYHEKTSRRLWKKYSDPSVLGADHLVAWVVRDKIILKEELEPEVLAVIEPIIKLHESFRESEVELS